MLALTLPCRAEGNLRRCWNKGPMVEPRDIGRSGRIGAGRLSGIQPEEPE